MGTSSGGVASMSAIRFSHIKRALGDSVYVVRGENTPRPRAGDLGIMISRSGESPSTIEWLKTMQENNARITAMVGEKESTLAKDADYPLVLGKNYFYMKAAYLCSVLALHLCERLSDKGQPLPEFILEWYHSVTE
jgi:D-arabinose 5-phosphate isomerase GutQ